jgi:hypothetical protein
VLDLSGNEKLDDAATARLCVALRACPHLVALRLGRNAIGDAGAAAIADLLESRA